MTDLEDSYQILILGLKMAKADFAFSLPEEDLRQDTLEFLRKPKGAALYPPIHFVIRAF